MFSSHFQICTYSLKSTTVYDKNMKRKHWILNVGLNTIYKANTASDILNKYNLVIE